jgi:hypothetical protein
MLAVRLMKMALVVSRAAGGEVAVSEAGAAGFLEQVEDSFAFAEGIEERAERAEVQAIGPHADEMAGDSLHLGDDHAKVAGFFGELVVEQLLDAQRPAEIHAHPGQVVHAVGVGDPLPRREVLADFFGAAVEIADVRLGLGDDLAVGPQDQAQHAVGAGVLWTHVHQHLVRADVEFNYARIIQSGRH